MKDFAFKIKVSDLLLNPGSKDSLSFEKKFISELPGLSTQGINGEISLTSLDEKTIMAEVNNITAEINDSCDICGKEFKRDINIPYFEAKFVQDKNDDDEHQDEEFMINPKDETIDIGEFLTQAIISSDPLVKKCETCTENTDEVDEPEDDDISKNQQNSSTIKWL